MSNEWQAAPQVAPAHYRSADYESKKRFASYWHQIDEVRRLTPASVLEVGPGSGFVSRYLKRLGLEVTTLDVDERLQPDVVGSITELPFDEGAFAVIACFEVLEHLPFEAVRAALDEMHRVAREHVLVSLPDVRKVYRVEIDLPPVWHRRFLIPRPWGRPTPHVFDGQHYWEIGKAGYPLERLCAVMEESGFTVERTYRVFENPYHRFFVLRKQSRPDAAGERSRAARV